MIERDDTTELINSLAALIDEGVHFLLTASERLELVVNNHKDINIDDGIAIVDKLRERLERYRFVYNDLTCSHSYISPEDVEKSKRLQDDIIEIKNLFNADILKVRKELATALGIR